VLDRAWFGEARRVAGALAVPQSAQVLPPTHALLRLLGEKEHRPPCPQQEALVDAAREGLLLRAVYLCGVGFSAGVPRPVRAWTARRAWAVLAAPQVVQAPQQRPRAARAPGRVTRPQ